jgi:hypothetical protein
VVGHSRLPFGVEIYDVCSPVRPLDGNRCTVQTPGLTPVLVSPQLFVWVISAPLHGRCSGSLVSWRKTATLRPLSKAAHEWWKARR